MQFYNLKDDEAELLSNIRLYLDGKPMIFDKNVCSVP